MNVCERCGKEFETEAGLEHHRRDKHGASSHDKRELKRQAQEEWKEAERKKAHGDKQRKTMLMLAGAALAVLVIGYFIFTSRPAPPQHTNYNLTGIPNRFVHWHADVDVVICGEERQLPYGPVGGMLGTNRLHTHDHNANIASLPGSDGNGIIHTEGTIPTAPGEHTLRKFMQNIGVKFSETEIMDKKNGDTCSSSLGSVKVFLNDQPLENPLNYLPRDQDFIRIEFSPDGGNATG